MKIICTLLTITSIFACNVFAQASLFNPQNTVIISGLDNVLVKKSLFLKYLTWRKNDEYSHNKLTTRLLQYGINTPRFAYYSARIAEYLEKSYAFIEDTAIIYSYLKEKGYSIVFATNKNRFSYEMLDSQLNLTDLADSVFVTQTNNDSETTAQPHQHAVPANYSDLLDKFTTIQQVNKIFTAPGKKPDQEYYNYVKNNIDHCKNIIFIDDSVASIDSFAATQKTSNTEQTGILFQNPLQLVEKYIELGILSEEDDEVLIEKIKLNHRIREAKAHLLDVLFSAIAASPSIANGIEGLVILYNEQKLCRPFINADKDVTDFIKTTLLKTHNIHIDNVKISSKKHSMGASRKHIFINPDIADELGKALKANDPVKDPIMIDLCRAILEHEGNHIKNNDMIWQSFCNILSPFIVDKLVTLLNGTCYYLPQQEKQTTYDQKDLMEFFISKSIGTGIKLTLTTMLAQAFSRYCEQRADNEISDNVVLLDSLKVWFEVSEGIEAKKVKNKSFFSKYFSWIRNFFETHPLNSVRIKKLEQRIALLNQKAA